jgi:enamine deaminase RidA (YjgF/YER057c/UK114 family)
LWERQIIGKRLCRATVPAAPAPVPVPVRYRAMTAVRPGVPPSHARGRKGPKVSAVSEHRKLISSGSAFESQIGYSRAVVEGDWVFVSGTTGFDYQTMAISEDIAEQTQQCFVNIESALKAAGSGMADIVRVRYLLPDAALFEATWPILQRWLGDVRPAATMMVVGLMDARMKIEIEVSARRRA